MFYDRFKDLSAAKKVSVSKAATDIGLSNSTPTKWKKTGATPDGATLSKISNYFSVSVGFLLGDGQKEAPTTVSGSRGRSVLSDDDIVALVLQRYREDANFTQDDVARYLSRSKEEISAYERGKRSVDANTVMLLLGYYHVTPAKFFSDIDFQLMQPMDG